MSNLLGTSPNEVINYLKVDHKYFEPLSNYRAGTTEFSKIIKTLLSKEANIGQSGIWLNVNFPKEKKIKQGFKIHLSTKPQNAVETLNIVANVCFENKTSFKSLCDSYILSLTLSKNFPRHSSGKFITIYPCSLDKFRNLCEILHKKTSHLDGPRILSDQNYKDSTVLFYRYGAFSKMNKLDVKGHKAPCIKDPDGDLIQDNRKPYYSSPQWVNEPFKNKKIDPDDNRKIILNGKYEITNALQFDNIGGVYEAIDTQKKRSAIIKEARPNTIYVGLDNTHFDALKVFEKEYKMLKILEEFDFVPNPYSIFQEGGHKFIAMEKVEGSDLVTIRAQDSFNPYLKSPFPEEKEIFKYCYRLLNLFEIILNKIYKIHQKKIIIGDIGAKNIIYNKKLDKITIIDFETSFISEGGYDQLKMGNIGYNQTRDEINNFCGDYYALGMLLISMFLPNQAMYPINKDGLSKSLDYIRKRGVPYAIINVINSLIENESNNPDDLHQKTLNKIKEGKASLSQGDISLSTKPILDSKDIKEKIDLISNAVSESATPERNDRLFPADYRIFSTNSLSLSFGAVGILLSLKFMGKNIKYEWLEWIETKNITHVDIPPGLYIGCAGIACGLYKLGLKEKAEQAIKTGNNSDLKYDSADIYYGAAGLGLANLFFFKRTENKHYLDRALSCAKAIKRITNTTPQGFKYYENLDGSINHGFAFGASGISFFFIKLFQATGNENHKLIAESFLKYDISKAQNKDQAPIWCKTENDKAFSPYWARGSSGIGSCLIRFYKITDKNIYKDLSIKIAEALIYKDAKYLGQFSGKVGIGEFFLDMYQITGEKKFHQEALRIAESIIPYEIRENHGIKYPGNRLLRICADFATGSAGIGTFYKRIISGKSRIIYDW